MNNCNKKNNPYYGKWNEKLKRPVTLFESHVYLLCSQIPLGKVSTYRLLGKSLECSSSQAIGQALKRNPFAPSPVPCHRIIKTDLDIGGYSGISYVNKSHEKILKKKKILEDEGITFHQGSFRIEEKHVFDKFDVSSLVLKKRLKKDSRTGATTKIQNTKRSRQKQTIVGIDSKSKNILKKDPLPHHGHVKRPSRQSKIKK